MQGCKFVGGLAPIAFVGVDGAVVRHNTIYLPDKWVVRILQENAEAGMVPSRNGRFEHNLIVFSGRVAQTAVNVGANTQPRTFVFRDNLWYCQDDPRHSRPELPTPEHNGVYAIDPKLAFSPEGIPAAPAAEAARRFGADALAAASTDPAKH